MRKIIWLMACITTIPLFSMEHEADSLGLIKKQIKSFERCQAIATSRSGYSLQAINLDHLESFAIQLYSLRSPNDSAGAPEVKMLYEKEITIQEERLSKVFAFAVAQFIGCARTLKERAQTVKKDQHTFRVQLRNQLPQLLKNYTILERMSHRKDFGAQTFVAELGTLLGDTQDLLNTPIVTD